MLIPIGRDDAEIRRHAWVSYVIVAINVVLFCVTSAAMRPSRLQSLNQAWSTAFEYYVNRPYLTPPAELAKLLPESARSELAEAGRAEPRRRQSPEVQREQAELNALVNRASEGASQLPFARFGYVPAEGGMLTLFTSMFLHAGLLHLLGNLLFFYLSGPFIEDVFGRPVFTLLYLSGGVVAALAYAFRDPTSRVPLVGASGAIAAVMGAYLFRFYRSKIELLFMPFLWRPSFSFRFFLPAFVVLPLWFLEQMIMMRGEADGGVAFSAHVGGFVYGFAFAAVVRVANYEKKFVDPRVTKETTWVMDDRLARALAAWQRGDGAAAKVDLASLLRDEPKNIDALRTALDVSYGERDWRSVDSLASRLLQASIEEKHVDAARDLISDVTALPEAHVPKFLARAAAYVERLGEREWALQLYERLYDEDPVGPTAIGTLVKTSAPLRASGEPSRAQEMLRKARAHPLCTAEWAQTIDGKMGNA